MLTEQLGLPRLHYTCQAKLTTKKNVDDFQESRKVLNSCAAKVAELSKHTYMMSTSGWEGLGEEYQVKLGRMGEARMR